MLEVATYTILRRLDSFVVPIQCVRPRAATIFTHRTGIAWLILNLVESPDVRCGSLVKVVNRICVRTVRSADTTQLQLCHTPYGVNRNDERRIPVGADSTWTCNGSDATHRALNRTQTAHPLLRHMVRFKLFQLECASGRYVQLDYEIQKFLCIIGVRFVRDSKLVIHPIETLQK